MTGRIEDVEIRTARLLLRAPREADIDEEVTACQDGLTQRWLPLPRPYRREDTARNSAQHRGSPSTPRRPWT